MQNLRISTRIAIAVTIPIVGLLALAAIQIADAMRRSNDMAQLGELGRLAPVISEVVHELQKERGMSAGFIGSGGVAFAQDLPTQRSQTDERQAQLAEALASFDRDGHGRLLSERLSAAEGMLGRLSETRGGVSGLTLKVPEMAKYYTGTIAQLLAVVETMVKLTDDAATLKTISTYVAFLQAKERAGLERAMGAAGFSAGEFKPAIYQRFLQLIAMQDTFLSSFATTASEEQTQVLQQTVTGGAVNEVDRMRKIAIDSVSSGSTEGVEGKAWFGAITEKINLMKAVEDKVAGDLQEQVEVLEASASDALMFFSLMVAGMLAATVGICVVFVRGIVLPLRKVIGAVKTLADGSTELDIDETDRKDEVGEIQAAVLVFRDNAIEMDRLRSEQAEIEKRAEQERRKSTNELADGFEATVRVVVDGVAGTSSKVKSMAETVAGAADQAQSRSTTVASAAEEASTNVQTVAASAEELSASIEEISRQVAKSSEIANSAARQAKETDADVAGLVEAAQKVGEVVNLISDIAEQTNLLALNATIEAARAGEAGKGFAVVASEVKSLANQTAKATEEISQQISSIQEATNNSASAIRAIGTTIGEINEIATAIASAIEEQGAATQEIARNVQEAASGTQEVTRSIAAVSNAASESGESATALLDSANELLGQSQTLSSEVDGFVAKVRAG